MKIGIFKIRTENVEKTTIALTRNRRCKQKKKVHVRSYSRLIIKVHFLWTSPLTVICYCCCCLFVKLKREYGPARTHAQLKGKPFGIIC